MESKRILIFNVNWLGDVVFSTAVIRNVRRNFPGSFIACIVPSRCFPVLKGNPYLDEIIVFDEKDRHKSLLAKLRFIGFLKRKRFDTVYLLHRSFSRALICFLAGIPQRVGHYTKKRAFLLTKKIVPPSENAVHRLDYYLDVIEKAGLRIEDRFADFVIPEEDAKFIDGFFAKNTITKNDFLVVLNPGGNWLPKRWPKEYWAQLADKLIKECGAKVIFTGSLNDKPLVESIKNLMIEKVISTCGIFNLKHLGALARRTDIFVTADSGPLHIANAAGAKRIIALFGPTGQSVTAPYPLKNVTILQKDVGCKIPCYVVDCKDNRCMKAIIPEDVLVRVKELVKNKK